MPKNVRLLVDTAVKSSILRKIAAEVAIPGGGVKLDSYYKDPNGGGGGVYGKGDNPVFGKSEPTRPVDAVINVASRASAIRSAAIAAEKLRLVRKRAR